MTDIQGLQGIVLFAGAGGVSQGLKDAGISDVTGIENNAAAVDTATKAGHNMLLADVLGFRTTEDMRALLHPYRSGLLLQASPPCQGLSRAGKGTGKADLDRLLQAVESVERTPESVGDWSDRLIATCHDAKSPLTFDIIRWVVNLDPDYVMLEQVPAALPIWEAIADLLRSWGYSVWTGNVSAEQYGVPQTRRRAILLASKRGDVSAPVPTHSKYHSRTPTKLDEGVLPWVSMAEALEWGMTKRPYVTVAPGTAAGGPDPQACGGSHARAVVNGEREAGRWAEKNVTHMGDVYNSNGCIRQVNEPAPTLTASMDNGNFQWIDHEKVADKVAERINNQSGSKFDMAWPAKRPAPVVAGRDLVGMPGANANRYNGSTKSRNDGVRVDEWEAGVLQSFPADYPWYGTKKQRFMQIGNAVPPLLQRVLTEQLLNPVH